MSTITTTSANLFIYHSSSNGVVVHFEYLHQGMARFSIYLETQPDDFEYPDPTINGSIRFDGCINWATDEQCRVHGCGPEHVGHIAVGLNAVYHIAATFYADCYEEAGNLDLPKDSILTWVRGEPPIFEDILARFPFIDARGVKS